MTEENAIRYRWIDGPDSEGPMPATAEEWDAIDATLQRYGWMSLNRALTRILVAETAGGEMVGFSVIQLVPNLGPIHVDKEHRGSGIADELAVQTIQFMLASKARGWIVVADSPHAEKLARDQGMTKLVSPVYVAGMTQPGAGAGEKVH